LPAPTKKRSVFPISFSFPEKQEDENLKRRRMTAKVTGDDFCNEVAQAA